MKKYNEFIKENMEFLHNLDDDELKEKLDDLSLEKEDIEDKIRFINSILKDRSERRSEEFADTLPDSIFAFNEDQLSFIFKHNHKTDKSKLNISMKYFTQELEGVYPSGFNPRTDQFSFNIVTRSCMDDKEENFQLDPMVVKSIKFLGKNLKKTEEGYIHFDVLCNYDEGGYRKKIHYVSENDIEYGSDNRMRKFNSIESLLKSVVENDLDEREDGTHRGW